MKFIEFTLCEERLPETQEDKTDERRSPSSPPRRILAFLGVAFCRH